MTYTVELTDDEISRVRNAKALGIDVSGLMRSIASAPPAASGHAPHTNGASKNGAATTAPPASNNETPKRGTKSRHNAPCCRIIIGT